MVTGSACQSFLFRLRDLLVDNLQQASMAPGGALAAWRTPSLLPLTMRSVFGLEKEISAMTFLQPTGYSNCAVASSFFLVALESRIGGWMLDDRGKKRLSRSLLAATAGLLAAAVVGPAAKEHKGENMMID